MCFYLCISGPRLHRLILSLCLIFHYFDLTFFNILVHSWFFCPFHCVFGPYWPQFVLQRKYILLLIVWYTFNGSYCSNFKCALIVKIIRQRLVLLIHLCKCESFLCFWSKNVRTASARDKHLYQMHINKLCFLSLQNVFKHHEFKTRSLLYFQRTSLQHFLSVILLHDLYFKCFVF